MILVTGAGGFLGRSVCARLRQENLDCIGADRRPSGSCEIPCDVAIREAVERLFHTHPIHAVIHLAAMLPSACRQDPVEATRVNVLGSANVLETAAASGIGRFVFGSSISVYRAATDADVYAAGKRYIEAYGETLARARGFTFAALRMATVVGPGARHTASPWRSEIFEKPASGDSRQIAIPLRADQVASLVYVADAAHMLTLLATRPQVPNPVYDTPSENWRMGDLKALLESLNRRVTVNLMEAPEDAGRSPALPLADGSSFARDFAWSAPPLADRLAACLLE